jgi:hypothetical protein
MHDRVLTERAFSAAEAADFTASISVKMCTAFQVCVAHRGVEPSRGEFEEIVEAASRQTSIRSDAHARPRRAARLHRHLRHCVGNRCPPVTARREIAADVFDRISPPTTPTVQGRSQ